MGHTRWATHGGPTDRNAHPHTDHRGRSPSSTTASSRTSPPCATTSRQRGVEMRSDTDTEVVAHLLGAGLRRRPHRRATCPPAWPPSAAACDGAFTLVAMHADVPETLVAARRNSPLVVGDRRRRDVRRQRRRGVHRAHPGRRRARPGPARGDHARTATTSPPSPVATPDLHRVPRRLGSRRRREGRLRRLHGQGDRRAAAGASPTPCSVTSTAPASCSTSSGSADDELRTIDKVFVVACGTAYHSGLVAKYAIEHWTRLPVEVEMASEFRYRDPVLDRDTLVVAVSQSGETADTLEAVRHARRQRARVLAVCNTNGSQIPRESDAVLYTHAGPEIGVASTKAFLAQVDGQLPGRAGAGAGPRHEVPRRDRARVRAARRRCRRRSRRR